MILIIFYRELSPPWPHHTSPDGGAVASHSSDGLASFSNIQAYMRLKFLSMSSEFLLPLKADKPLSSGLSLIVKFLMSAGLSIILNWKVLFSLFVYQKYIANVRRIKHE